LVDAAGLLVADGATGFGTVVVWANADVVAKMARPISNEAFFMMRSFEQTRTYVHTQITYPFCNG
jgi:hypothetical protein